MKGREVGPAVVVKPLKG